MVACPSPLPCIHVLTCMQHFEAVGQAWQQQDMRGGSDYLPFILKQIPAGGLATGAR